MTKNAVFFVKAEQGKQRLGKQGKSGVKLGAKLCLAHFTLVFLLGLTIYLLFISRLLGQNIVLLEFSKVLVYFWRVYQRVWTIFCITFWQDYSCKIKRIDEEGEITFLYADRSNENHGNLTNLMLLH